MTGGQTRPKYENDSTLKAEERVIKWLSTRGQKTLLYSKLPISYEFDYALFDTGGRIVSFVEIKCRNMYWGQYDTIVLSLGKYMKGLEYKRIRPAFFVVEARGAVYIHDFTEENLFLEYGGRTKQTRDPADIEPIVKIPINQFKRVGNIGGI